MAYTQTTASSLQDVISQLCAFAVAQAGFTNNGTATYGGKTYHRISKGGIYWTFVDSYYSSKNHILLRMSYNISDTVSPTNLNGQWDWTVMSCWGFAGPFPTLYMFSDGSAVHGVLELTNGIFNHISFGNIQKTDTFEGGEYCASQFFDRQYWDVGYNANRYYWDDHFGSTMFPGGWITRPYTSNLSYIRSVQVSGVTNAEGDFAAFSNNRNNQHAIGVGVNGILDPLMRDSPNSATLRTPLFPCYVNVRDPVTGLYRSTGYVGNIRLVNMKYVDPGEIILNDWQVFPFIQEEGTGISCPVTGNWGWAYKRA